MLYKMKINRIAILLVLGLVNIIKTCRRQVWYWASPVLAK